MTRRWHCLQMGGSCDGEIVTAASSSAKTKEAYGWHPLECAYLIKAQLLAARIPRKGTQKGIEFLGGVAKRGEILAENDDDVWANLFCFLNELQFVQALEGFSVLSQADEGIMQARFSFPCEQSCPGGVAGRSSSISRRL